LSLDIFNRNAEKVGMANIAQLVNCLQSLFLAHEDRFCVTPTYHVFDMYSAHQGAEAVRTVFTAPPVSYTRNGAPAELVGLAGSASVRGRQITLTVANPHLEQSRETEISVRGGFLSSARVTTLAAQDAHAHNTLSEPRAVEPAQPQSVTVNRGRIVHRFPPASVTKLELGLA
jgi:alpha-N-arabinofuranosidase